MLNKHPELNEQFLGHMLKRNIRIEEDLIDHLFNSVENGSPERSCSWRGTE